MAVIYGVRWYNIILVGKEQNLLLSLSWNEILIYAYAVFKQMVYKFYRNKPQKFWLVITPVHIFNHTSIMTIYCEAQKIKGKQIGWKQVLVMHHQLMVHYAWFILFLHPVETQWQLVGYIMAGSPLFLTIEVNNLKINRWEC